MKLFNTLFLFFLSANAFGQSPRINIDLIPQDEIQIDASQVLNLPSGGSGENSATLCDDGEFLGGGADGCIAQPAQPVNGDNCAANEYHRGVDEFGNVENCQPIPDDQTAPEVQFDPSGSALISENVESAIKEVDEKVENIDIDITSIPLFQGVLVDAAPDWVDGLVMTQNQLGTVSTGIDLTKIDSIIVHFARNVNASGDNLWPAPEAKIRISDIELGKQQGALLAHFDNQFLAIDNTTQAMLEAGDIQFKAVSNNAAFGFEITRIQFRKLAQGASNTGGGTQNISAIDTPHIDLEINNNNLSANIVDGSIGSLKLSEAANNSLDLANTALQDVAQVEALGFVAGPHLVMSDVLGAVAAAGYITGITSDEVLYDNDASTLASDSVKEALDELDLKIENLPSSAATGGASSETATSGPTTQGYGVLTVTVSTTANSGNGETVITIPEAFVSGKTKVFEGDAALRIIVYTEDTANNTLTLPFATNEIITVDYDCLLYTSPSPRDRG